MGGNPLWQETQNVEVVDGLFDVNLGSVNPIPDSALSVNLDDSIYLEVTINGETLEPRTKFTAVPFSFQTKRVKGDIFTGPNSLTLFNCKIDWCDDPPHDTSKVSLNILDIVHGDTNSIKMSVDSSSCAFNMVTLGDIMVDTTLFEMSTNDNAAILDIVYKNGAAFDTTWIEMRADSGGSRINMLDVDTEGHRKSMFRPGYAMHQYIGDLAVDTTLFEMQVNSSGGELGILYFDGYNWRDQSIIKAGGMAQHHSEDGGISVDTTFWEHDRLSFNSNGTALNLGLNGISIVDNIAKANDTAFSVDAEGNLQVSGFAMTFGASSGYVLTCNSSGVGTWQPGGAGSGCWECPGNYTYLADSNDSVGIGTSSPLAKLDVRGDTRLAGDLQIYGNLSLGLSGDYWRISTAITGTADTNALFAMNYAGTAATFSSGPYSPGYSSNPSAIYAAGTGGNWGGIFTSYDGGNGVYSQIEDNGVALYGKVFSGTGYSGYFEGGSGVYVEGDLHVEDKLTITPDTSFYTVWAADFMPQSNNITYYIDHDYSFHGQTPGQSITLFVPIHLPDSARIVSFRAHVYDNSSSEDVSCLLFQKIGADATSGFSTLTSSGTNGDWYYLVDNTVNHIVNNGSDKFYGVKIEWTVPSSYTFIRVQFVQVRYVVTDLAQ